MGRLWQFVWDRYGSRYSWALWAIVFQFLLPVYLVPPFAVVALEKSDRYLEAAAITAVGLLLPVYVTLLPGLGDIRLAEQCAAGVEVDRAKALEATYTWARRTVARALVSNAVALTVILVVVGAAVGATWSRLIQYGILGAAYGAGIQVIAVHSFAEAALRPARIAIAGDMSIGDSLPRSRPTFAVWSDMLVVAVSFVFAVGGAIVAAVFNRVSEVPVASVVIGCALTLVFGVPMTVGASFSPSLRPIRELTEATKRVAAGDYRQRVPVVQDDDLGALAASFNRMQAGLAERQRLQAAFGTYVGPALAARLLEQGDDVFTGERREVTVMFVDVRDFTPFAEANTPENTVSRLNALFEIMVPAVMDAGGHVNKFLGDGALAVFAAPNDLADHADAAVSAAVLIHRLVAERFGETLQIGIGINTGAVIAGTIGGGGKLEFTLIGDTVNVAARVEQLTKTTGDAILLTQQCVDALESRPAGLIDRGRHVLKGKTDPVQVFGLDHEVDARVGFTR
ncbi:cyclase [Mycobacterium sp. E2327]|uniref:adenylate/guanylate cyclase domain-containing protein n=1 Tax=Mycobacterium sp. E2327 TaxID=1834132 RepID=UPI0007FE2335|nr:adenylate/guanylate cyclase domain-containing protein [Mycobacterium sp. E2327]OBI19409.1 cyclase [Mycobacterium sp. E2327]